MLAVLLFQTRSGLTFHLKCSAWQMIHMKYQALFCQKNEKVEIVISTNWNSALRVMHPYLTASLGGSVGCASDW